VALLDLMVIMREFIAATGTATYNQPIISVQATSPTSPTQKSHPLA
jgi:hypothetical protein